MSILPEARKPSCFEWRLGDHISPPLPNPNCLISHELLTSHAALGPLALRFSLRVTYSLQEHEVKTEYLNERVQGAILSSHYLKIASFCQKCTGLHPLSHPVSGIKQCVSPSPLVPGDVYGRYVWIPPSSGHSVDSPNAKVPLSFSLSVPPPYLS